MSYERDTDSHLKGVGTIAAQAGARPRSSAKRRMKVARGLRARDRMMASMTMGPRGAISGYGGLGMIKIPAGALQASRASAPVVQNGGVVEGGLSMGPTMGGTISMPTSTGGPGATVKTKASLFTAASGPLGVNQAPVSYTAIPIGGSTSTTNGNGTTTTTTIDPTTGGATTTTTATTTTDPGAGTTVVGGGGGAGIPAPGAPDGLPTIIDTTPVDVDDGTTGMSTNMKIALGLGAAAAAYFLFFHKKDGG